MKNKMKLFGFLGAVLVTASTSKATETIIDLTGGPPEHGTANGALLFAADPRPTGTGFINPFLREDSNGNATTENGVNTSISAPPLDDKPGIWTHDQTVSGLSVISQGGVNYYEFALDANQIGNGPISLTSFKIFVTGGAPFTTTTALLNELTLAPSFDLENGTPGSVRVDISSNTGSGSGDMFILVPVLDIGTTGNLYLEAGFSADLSGSGGYTPNDGFEEWNAITKTAPPTPDGCSTMTLLGAALVGMGWLRKMTSKK